jgi:hypothetical protein
MNRHQLADSADCIVRGRNCCRQKNSLYLLGRIRRRRRCIFRDARCRSICASTTGGHGGATPSPSPPPHRPCIPPRAAAASSRGRRSSTRGTRARRRRSDAFRSPLVARRGPTAPAQTAAEAAAAATRSCGVLWGRGS